MMAEQPRLLARIWAGWKRIAKKIGNFQARVFLFLFYFTVFCPFALAVRWTSDPLSIKKGAPPGWLPLPEGEGTALERARRQF